MIVLQQIILMLRRKKFIFYKYSVRTFTESRKRPFLCGGEEGFVVLCWLDVTNFAFMGVVLC